MIIDYLRLIMTDFLGRSSVVVFCLSVCNGCIVAKW